MENITIENITKKWMNQLIIHEIYLLTGAVHSQTKSRVPRSLDYSSFKDTIFIAQI